MRLPHPPAGGSPLGEGAIRARRRFISLDTFSPRFIRIRIHWICVFNRFVNQTAHILKMIVYIGI